ncbi:hypothetical protein MKW94_010940 [Papaver nudicaule]|uniref:Helicase C-terminal domain-containing protein n=1 Tax=Papaver nudicaule TaxID=74823 RepID=A0AA41S5C3_PAPNU|nr:hypothetical protein [Papaver nudicaule]
MWLFVKQRLSGSGREVIPQAQSGTGKTSMIALTVSQIVETSNSRPLSTPPPFKITTSQQNHQKLLEGAAPIPIPLPYNQTTEITIYQMVQQQLNPPLEPPAPTQFNELPPEPPLFTKIITVLVFLVDAVSLLKPHFSFPLVSFHEYLDIVSGAKQFIVAVEKEEWKFDTLCDLYDILTITQAVIFCNTKRKLVDWLTEKMCSYNITVSSMHGDMPQKERSTIMEEFRSGDTLVLITTDVWACAIEFNRQVHHVHHSGVGINFVRSDDIRHLFLHSERRGLSDLSDSPDDLIVTSTSSSHTVKEGCKWLITQQQHIATTIPLKSIWIKNIPPKVQVFPWFLYGREQLQEWRTW